jgi:hypothetical protein
MEITNGFSGAPVLYEGKVIGIANGGLDKGRTHLCWAILVNTIKLEKISGLKEKYERLKKIKPESLIHGSFQEIGEDFNQTNFIPLSQFLALGVKERLNNLKNKYTLINIPYVYVKYTKMGTGDIREKIAEELGSFFKEQNYGEVEKSSSMIHINCFVPPIPLAISYHPKNETFAKEIVEALKGFIESPFSMIPNENETIYEVKICIDAMPNFNSTGKVKFE